MQKKLIALAVAGLATGAAFAQSNVTIYGQVDYGFMNRGGQSGGSANVYNKAEFGSGLQAGSRIGFRGAEDLGNGLKAIFEVEYGIAVDQVTGVAGSSAASNSASAAATWLNRHSYVGLTGGFGTAVGGRLDGVRYGVFNTYDPFAGGTVGNFTQMTGQVDRADNAIAYISPNFNGLTLTLAYASNVLGNEGANSAVSTTTTALTNTQAASFYGQGNDGDNRLNTIMLGYENGPISAKFDYETIKTRGLEGKTWVSTLGGSYDLGVAKLSALYDIFKSDTGGADVDVRAWMVGAKAPVAGKFAVKANYGRVQNKNVDDADASKWAVGVDYALSKRTNLYADYSRINNDNGAGFMISPAANAVTALAPLSNVQLLNSQNNGYGIRGFDLGIRHTF